MKTDQTKNKQTFLSLITHDALQKHHPGTGNRLKNEGTNLQL